MRYSIDTSSIIYARRRAYPPDVFPSLWERIDGIARNGDLIATEEVLHELQQQDDEVYAWARQQAQLFIPTNEEIQRAVRVILEQHPNLVDTRRNRSGADPFVIALAQTENCAVVTQEVPTRNPARPKIPDVCSAMGTRSISVLQMIREQGWTI